MTMEFVLALLSLSAPITATILGGVVWVWKRKVVGSTPPEGPYLTTREFDLYTNKLDRRLDAIFRKLDTVEKHIT